MIPVDQTVLRSPRELDGPPGNCFAACLASLLHLPIEDVPAPTLGDVDWSASGGYWERIASWLADRGLHMVEVDRDRGLVETSTVGYLTGVDWYWIATGLSPRGDFLHSVIFRGRELAHDPHPSRAGLDGGIVKAGYLVPLDPFGVTR